MIQVLRSPFLLIAFVLVAISCSSINQKGLTSTRPLPKKELIEDLNYLNEAVVKTHPIIINPAWSNKLDSFVNSIEQIEGEEISAFEYDNAIREAVSLLGCVHTAVMKSPLHDLLSAKINEMGNYYFFPLRLFVDSSGLYIIDLDSTSHNSSIQFPFQVDSINGMGSQELIYAMSVHIPQDGYQKTFAYKILNEHGAYSLRRHFYDVNSVLIKGKTANGEKIVVNVEAVQKYDNRSFRYYQPEEIPIVKEKDVSFFDLGPESAYLKLESVIYENYPMIHDTIFEYLASNNKKNLIIDLRGNGGGSQMVYLDFLSHLSSDSLRIEMVKRDASESKFFNRKRRKDKPYKEFYNRSERMENGTKYFINPLPPKTTIFKGNLYVLIDGGTASGASQLASFLKNRMNAICIGQETGGGETGNNGHGYDQLELPNSTITINWPRYNVKLDLPIPINHRGVTPNFEIKYDPKSYLLNRDLEMEKVFQLMGSSDFINGKKFRRN
jgi:hypothetical protein